MLSKRKNFATWIKLGGMTLLSIHWLRWGGACTIHLHIVLKNPQKQLMAFTIPKKKNPAPPSWGEFYSLSTGPAEFFDFVVLRVPLVFFLFQVM